jgi:hypothetical protein
VNCGYSVGEGLRLPYSTTCNMVGSPALTGNCHWCPFGRRIPVLRCLWGWASFGAAVCDMSRVAYQGYEVLRFRTHLLVGGVWIRLMV